MAEMVRVINGIISAMKRNIYNMKVAKNGFTQVGK
jgi:hypothetical protein